MTKLLERNDRTEAADLEDTVDPAALRGSEKSGGSDSFAAAAGWERPIIVDADEGLEDDELFDDEEDEDEDDDFLEDEEEEEDDDLFEDDDDADDDDDEDLDLGDA